MKKLFIAFTLLVAFSSVAYANSIAIEFRENDQFAQIVGKVLYTGRSLEMVAFGLAPDAAVDTHAFIYDIVEKKRRQDDVYFIKCRNQLGITMAGIIDVSEYGTGKIDLISDMGLRITNLSMDGARFHRKYLPKVYLGR